ncbi:A/G-specific adenine glycosylase [Phycicoccus sp. CSK15P-2]|uniref:A/G-specific adenine glycosylase n=1 Tax=Phycicoccus sp. CSK15P-2 TaxID=2807627 RepID=UPI00194E52DC|nr:A/G-specific adenine glycosylase [Phycicoccus sp. CSK15P-2]MBM6403556.1 A/G-specific adenine glycosylase [Phycicoccus sp. CSK15P-2]
MTLDPATLHDRVLDWYRGAARDLPWRDPSCTPWGVLVSEVMSQQTPVARVEPVWRAWMTRWPTAASLAAASPGDVVRAWGRLGYPRRALRLREAAVALVDRHGGEVPDDEDDLRALPGVGAYTAAALAAFAHGRRTVVVDTNVRRVLARAVQGRALASPSLTAAEQRLAASLVPEDPATSAVWNVAVMELGALVCRARGPECGSCPLEDVCAWVAAGSPPDDGPPRRGQAWAGTDRQVRGALVQVLREVSHAVAREALEETVLGRLGLPADRHTDQLDRCLASLVEDGLVEPVAGERYRLPA